MSEPPTKYLVTGGQGQRYHVIDPQAQARHDTVSSETPQAISFCRRPGEEATLPKGAQVCRKCLERRAAIAAAPTPKPLPFALEHLELRISTTRAIVDLHNGEFDKYVTRWDVDVVARNLDGAITTTDIAVGRLWVMDLPAAEDDGLKCWDLLDSESEELMMVGSGFTVGGDVDPALGVGYGSIVCLDRITVNPAYRGHGIGPLVAALALHQLRGGCTLAVCYPAPTDRPRGTGRAKRIAELGRIWSKVGFELFRDGVWTIHLDETRLDDALETLLDATRDATDDLFSDEEDGPLGTLHALPIRSELPDFDTLSQALAVELRETGLLGAQLPQPADRKAWRKAARRAGKLVGQPIRTYEYGSDRVGAHVPDEHRTALQEATRKRVQRELMGALSYSSVPLEE